MLFLRKQNNGFDKALSWFRAHRVPGQGIIVHTRQPVSYPEVTGYFVPTLYEWGEDGLARACIDWLLSVQLPDGAFPAADGVAYTFDTAQVMRGLNAALERGRPVKASLERAASWMVKQIGPDGRLDSRPRLRPVGPGPRQRQR